MTQQNTIQTNQILATLVEYEAAQAELERVKRFTREGRRYIKVGEKPGYEKDAQGKLTNALKPDNRLETSVVEWPEMDAAQARLAALPPLPTREEAEAACMAELERMAGEYQAAWAELKTALQAELACAEALEVARVRQRYARTYEILGLPTAEKPTEDAHAALVLAENQRRATSNKRTVIQNHFNEQYPGATIDNPAGWPAAAAARVERILGPYYHKAEAAELKTRLGITDKMLSFLTKAS